MSWIEVQSPGMFTTVQDLGRYGYGPIGVSPSGAADPLALRIGNLLTGNLESAAALEMTLLGGTFVFPKGATIALAGAEFAATIDSSPIAHWAAHELRPGATVRIAASQTGARCYLCVRGGIDVPLLLASASTHILTGLGGFEGRALKRGDRLQIGQPSGTPRVLRRDLLATLAPRKILRATGGPQTEWFSREAIDLFFSSTYKVTDDSNRMGLRLEGPVLETPHGGQMISEGVSLGALQIPAGGQPILLFVEQQTTGGYPKIANVISADLAGAGQLRPRDEIRFEHVSPETARAAIRDQEELLLSGALFE